MSLQNLEQVRAKHALAFAKSEAPKHGANGGDAMKKIPSMIMANGLLAAIAFAVDLKYSRDNKLGENHKTYKLQRSGFASAFAAIREHLASPEIDVLKGLKFTPPIPEEQWCSHQKVRAHFSAWTQASAMLEELTQSDSECLKLATDEALQWLGYARRFIVAGPDAGGDE